MSRNCRTGSHGFSAIQSSRQFSLPHLASKPASLAKFHHQLRLNRTRETAYLTRFGQIAGFSPEANLEVRFLKLNFVFRKHSFEPFVRFLRSVASDRALPSAWSPACPVQFCP
jgi:hypothetical protein